MPRKPEAPKPNCDPPPTGRKTGRKIVPGRNPHTGKPQGLLVQSERGSNGGEHRGPDKFPRRNVVRAQYMAALALGEVAGWPVLDKHGNVKIRNGKVVLAKAENMRAATAGVIAYRVIFARAERGLGPDLFLRMQRDAHEALQPAKDEEKARDQEPIRAVFQRACTHEQPPDQVRNTGDAARTAEPAPPPTGLVVDGQLYE